MFHHRKSCVPLGLRTVENKTLSLQCSLSWHDNQMYLFHQFPPDHRFIPVKCSKTSHHRQSFTVTIHTLDPADTKHSKINKTITKHEPTPASNTKHASFNGKLERKRGKINNKPLPRGYREAGQKRIELSSRAKLPRLPWGHHELDPINQHWAAHIPQQKTKSNLNPIEIMCNNHSGKFVARKERRRPKPKFHKHNNLLAFIISILLLLLKL